MAKREAIIAKANADAEALVERRAKMAEDKIAAEERAAIAGLRATAANAATPGGGQADRRAQRRGQRRQAGRQRDRGARQGGLSARLTICDYCWCWPPGALTPSSARLAAASLASRLKIAEADDPDQLAVGIEHRQAADLGFAHPLRDRRDFVVVAGADDLLAHQVADRGVRAAALRQRRAQRYRGR